MTIGERIKKLREEKNLTQMELAEKIHVGRDTINKWENGRDINTTYLTILADFFCVDCDYILRGVSAENRSISAATGLSNETIDALKASFDRDSESFLLINWLLRDYALVQEITKNVEQATLHHDRARIFRKLALSTNNGIPLSHELNKINKLIQQGELKTEDDMLAQAKEEDNETEFYLFMATRCFMTTMEKMVNNATVIYKE